MSQPLKKGKPPVSLPVGTGAHRDWSREVEARRDGSAWRMLVGARLQVLEAEIDCRPGTAPVPDCVHTAMEVACRATQRRSFFGRWFTGADIERAWRALHLAEVKLVSSAPDLAGRMPSIRVKVAAKLGRTDERRKALDAPQFDKLAAQDQRAAVAAALTAAYTASDDAETAVRSLRNRIVLFGLLLLAMNMFIAVFSTLKPDLLALCGESSRIATCASRAGQDPSGGDVLWLQMFGALGGALGVVLLLLRTKPSVVIYSVPPFQAALKIMLGAVFALVGVLVLSTGVFSSVVTTRPALLLFAVVLGYSQELGTRVLDTYADKVVQKAQPAAGPATAAKPAQG